MSVKGAAADLRGLQKKKREKKRKVWISCLPVACFGRQPSVAVGRGGGDAQVVEKKGSSFLWPKLRRGTKRTVPVDAISMTAPEKKPVEHDKEGREKEADPVLEVAEVIKGNSLVVDAIMIAAATTKTVSKPSVFRRLFPKLQNSENTETGTPKSGKARSTRAKPSHASSRLPHITPKYTTRNGPVHSMSLKLQNEPSREQPTAISTRFGSNKATATPSSAIQCSFSTPKCRKLATKSLSADTSNSTMLGLTVIAVMLLTLLLGDQVLAIFCTCAWLYLLPRLRMTEKGKGHGEIPQQKRKDVEVKYDSEDYKKKVILEGLLERNGRKITVL